MTNTLFCAFVIALWVSISCRAESKVTNCYSLEQYIAIVLSKNQELQIKQYKVRQAQAQTVSAKKSEPFMLSSTLNNSVSGQLSTDILDSVKIVHVQSDVLNATVSKKFITGTKLGLTYGYTFSSGNSHRLPESMRDYHSTNLNVSLEQPLLAGLSNIIFSRDLLGARIDEKISTLDFEAACADIISKAISTYFNVQRLQNQLVIKRSGLELMRQSATTIEALVKKKFEKTGKLLQCQSQLLEKEIEVYTMENEHQESYTKFLDLIDQTDGVDSIVLTSQPFVPSNSYANVQIDSLWSIALDNRIDYTTACETVARSELRLATAKSTNLPNLNMTGSYYIYGTDPKFDETFARLGSQNYNSWSVGLTFSMPIDKGYIKNKIFPIEIAYKEAAYRKESLKKKIRQDLMNALNKLKMNDKQYSLNVNALAISQRNMEEAQLLFDKGYMGVNEYIELQKNKESSEFSTLKSQIEYTINSYELQKAEGILLTQFPQSP